MKKRIYKIGRSTLALEFGDLTKSTADVLVSSDDSYVTMGGGVSAAILRAGGQGILIDAAKKVPARLGDVVVTSAGSLRAKHVFHAITIADESLRPKEIIASATRRCLELADAIGISSIAFPAIGAGVAGFSYDEVAGNMAETIVEHFQRSPRTVEATIYLYDRFGRMQAIDYLSFFEEFAARTKGLDLVAIPSRPASRRARPRPSAKAKQHERRKERLIQLAELDRERQTLEVKLAEYEGRLSGPQVKQVERRLKEVHDERIGILAEVKPTPAASPVSVFVSYAHADEKLRKELGKHLSVLERQGLIATWHDRMIAAGADWEGVIDSRLDESRIILLLVSADFIDSSYCYEVEMKRALDRHERGEALVIPVILRPVSLKGTPFARIQALPKDARATTDWPNLDSALVDITEGLRAALQNLRRLPNNSLSAAASRSSHG